MRKASKTAMNEGICAWRNRCKITVLRGGLTGDAMEYMIAMFSHPVKSKGRLYITSNISRLFYQEENFLRAHIALLKNATSSNGLMAAQHAAPPMMEGEAHFLRGLDIVGAERSIQDLRARYELVVGRE